MQIHNPKHIQVSISSQNLTGFILYKRCFVKIKFKVIRSATPCLTQTIKIVHGFEKICSLWQHFLAILWWYQIGYTAQKMKKSVMENFIFCEILLV